MSTKNKLVLNRLGPVVLIITIISVVIFIALLILTPEILSPYMINCHELVRHVGGLTPVEGVQYMETNPGATGQDVVDYYMKQPTKINELLNNPIKPSG